MARIGLVALAAGLVLAAAPAQAFGAGRVAGLTVSPQPGTPDASPTTQISLLGVPASRILNVRVRGARSGLHRGRLRPYSSGDGASFVPGHRFSQGEVVSVRVTASSVSGRQRHGLFRFRVGGHADLVMPPGPAPPSTPKGAHSYVSRPDLHPPVMSITARRDGRAAGDLFVSTILAPGHRPPIHGQIGPMIFDDQGEPVWVSPSPARREAFTFRVQTYRGSPVLTWWQGRLSFLGLGFGENVIADSTYRVLARVRAGNGYHADLHEFTIDDRDSGWVTIYVPVLVRFGGRRVPVLDSIVQRVDIPTGLVMFEWHSLGNIGLRESYVKRPKGRLPWDAFHVNSIELDRSGNLLLSERNTWAVYKVSGRTGRILWRLGGKRSNFRLSRHARFAWQHDAHRQADGTITIFDDEAAPRAGHESRGITLSLHGHRARLARSYINRRHLLAGSQGNMQVLPGGNVLVGWGAKPYLSEYSPNGRHLLFEARFPRGDESYRAYRFDWVGRPTTLPAVAARLRGGKLTVYASWNGATEVASWRVLAGGAPDALQPAAVAARSGFETKVPVAGPGPYVAVEALDAAGRVLGTSATVKGT